MESTGTLKEIAKELGMPVSDTGQDLNRHLLAGRINELIDTDFNQLVFILYRMDVNEDKLKQLLKSNPGNDAGPIIADLMIERQEQKNKSRNESKNSNQIADDEKW